MLSKKTFISSKFYSMLTGGIITSFFLTFTVMADAFIAGLRLGEHAVIGVNLVMPAYSLASFFALLFSLGVPIIYSREVGAFEKSEADNTLGVGILCTSFIGVVLFVLLYFCGNTYLEYMNPESATLIHAENYLFWIKYVVLISPFEALLSGMVFADGDELLSTIANVTSAISNIVLSVYLAGINGASGLGFASFISLVASLFILSFHFIRRGNSLRIKLYFSFSKFIKIVKYSIVDSSTYLFLMLFLSIMNSFIFRTYNGSMLALVPIIAFIKEIQIVFSGVGDALTPIISVYLGEKTYQGVIEVWKLARKTAAIISIIVTVGIMLGAPYIVYYFGIENPQTVKIAVDGLRIMSITLIFTSRMYLDSSYYILIDKIPLGVLICALRDFVIAVPFAVIGDYLWGVYGLFIGIMIAPVFGYLIAYFYVCIKYGRDSYVLFIPPLERERHIWMYEFEVTPEVIVAIRDKIGDTLIESGQSDGTVNRVMILFEELFMLIYDLNPEKTVLAECIVESGNRVRIITKDDGIYYDLTDRDQKIESLRSFIVSEITEKLTRKRINLISLSFNRNAFEIE
ncbi:MATE family efflux transporter [Pseudobutyrivibrio sp. MD2005]|uniref:MATE family efflux transporter n=1 Tax=Pseudobutyrivibrio sp. MD2005 TaxID=1410616 RepID=UPI00047FA7B7|nr:MATE family efflux transporter [Pseudobutyrivibrio sp. MD2005]